MKAKTHLLPSFLGMFTGSSLAILLLELFQARVCYHQFPPVEEVAEKARTSLLLWPGLLAGLVDSEQSVSARVLVLCVMLLLFGIALYFGLTDAASGWSFLASFLCSAASFTIIVICVVVAIFLFLICVILALVGVDADPDFIIFFKK